VLGTDVYVTVLGSGTVAPTRDRTASAYWIETAQVRLLLDCGAGAMHRAAQFNIPWATATHVAISHFHVDHWGELPFFLFALRWGIEPPRSEPLVILGPTGIRERLALLGGAYGDWVTVPDFPLEIVEIVPGDRYELSSDAELEACKTPHTTESLAYAIRSQGTRLVYTGDTGYSDELADWAKDCDLLIAECSMPDEREVELHLTPSRAGALARTARARRLVLTHFYPVFGDTDPALVAAESFGSDVVAARDGDRFTVGLRQPEVDG
jgi:ribonuclease BN (tRNA processing enzyme)